jgi:hypothetical protein
VTQSATPPSAAQVKAGEDNSGNPADDDGSQAVIATGTQDASASGLTADTDYWAYFMQEDAIGNQSNVDDSPQFTTDAPPPIAFVVGTSAIQNNHFSSGTITFNNMNGGVNYPAGALVVIGINQNQGGAVQPAPLIGGNAMSVVTGTASGTTTALFQYQVGGSAIGDTLTIPSALVYATVSVAGCYMTGMNSAVSAAANGQAAAVQPIRLASPISVPASGFGVAFFSAGNVALTDGTNTVTWTDCDNSGGDTNTYPAGGLQAQCGANHKTGADASWDPRVSGNTIPFNFFGRMVAASWGP